MTDPRFGWEYPAGAENDPKAPGNEEDEPEDEPDEEEGCG